MCFSVLATARTSSLQGTKKSREKEAKAPEKKHKMYLTPANPEVASNRIAFLHTRKVVFPQQAFRRRNRTRNVIQSDKDNWKKC